MQASSLYFDYAYVLVFGVFGALFVVINVSIVGRLARPFVKDPQKEMTYECGEPAVGSGWVRFDMRFYTVALLFLIFDVEVAFLYPWALVFRELKAAGLFVFVEMAIFLGILLVGFIYVWARGDLDWIKSTAAQGSELPGTGSREKKP